MDILLNFPVIVQLINRRMFVKQLLVRWLAKRNQFTMDTNRFIYPRAHSKNLSIFHSEWWHMPWPLFTIRTFILGEYSSPGSSFGVSRKYWALFSWQEVLTSSSKTRFSLAASIPWLISSTQRKGTVVNSCRASMYKAVATLLSPPDCWKVSYVYIKANIFHKHLVMSSQLLQKFSVPILHHDVHSIILKVILKLPSMKEHLLWKVEMRTGLNKDV